MPERGECIQTIVDLEYDIAAFAAVSAVRTSGSNILFPPETDVAVSAFA